MALTIDDAGIKEGLLLTQPKSFILLTNVTQCLFGSHIYLRSSGKFSPRKVTDALMFSLEVCAMSDSLLLAVHFEKCSFSSFLPRRDEEPPIQKHRPHSRLNVEQLFKN